MHAYTLCNVPPSLSGIGLILLGNLIIFPLIALNGLKVK